MANDERTRIERHLRALPPSEVFNLTTHLAGALLALIGLVYLVAIARGALALVAVIVYGVSLVTLYVASTLHHALPHSERRDSPLRRFDHVSIYLLIMGTYAPPCLLYLPREWGWPILGAVWLFGAIGIALKIFRPFTPRWVTVALYVAMGWTVVVAVVPLRAMAGAAGLPLLLAGGIVYTLGAVMYATKKPDLWPRYVGFHGLWHVFVLVASGLHFAFIAGYVVTR
ncbi:MAG: PAQR family membrane homeostasis protein TrhA [Thermoplasmatota archaeon]